MSRKQAAKSDGWSPPLAALAVFLVTAVVCGLRLGSLPLLEPDEARYAAVGQEMWASGDFVTPRVNGFVYLDKPPLLHWLTALSVGAFGPRGFAVRLSSLLAAAAGVTVVYAFARRVFGHQAGLASAVVLATSLMWFAVGRMIRYDMLLALSITATVWCSWLGFERGREGRWHLCLAALAAGLGVLVKGPIALVLPVAILLPYLAITRRLSALIHVPWLPVIGILAIVIVPWFAICEHANPGAVRFFLLHENLARVAGEIDQRHQLPWWYLGAILLGACIPWTLFLFGAAADAIGGCRHGEEPQRRACLLWLLWAVIPLVLFSLSKVKVMTYALPSLPPLALLIGRHVSPVRRKGRWAALATAPLLLLVAGALLFVDFKDPLPVNGVPVAALLVLGALAVIVAAALGARKWAVGLLAAFLLASYHAAFWSAGSSRFLASDKAIAAKVAELRRPGERVFSVRQLSRGTAFYLNERVAVFGNPPAEYDFPGNTGKLDGWVYPMEDAESVLAPGPTAIIICRPRHWPEFQAAVHGMVTTIGETDRALILRSEPRPALDVDAGEPPP